MKYFIKSRLDPDYVIFTADIDCPDDTSEGRKLALAAQSAELSTDVLRNADLSGANLRNVDLSGAKFCGANLRGVKMQHANIVNADFSNSLLETIDLESAFIKNTNFSNAEMNNAYFNEATLIDVNMFNANLSDAIFWGIDPVWSNVFKVGTRQDGLHFYAQIKAEGIWILAGDIYLSTSKSEMHWRCAQEGQQLLDESLQILKNARDTAKIRGLS